MPVVDALAERTDEGRGYALDIDGLPLTALPVGFRMRQLTALKNAVLPCKTACHTFNKASANFQFEIRNCALRAEFCAKRTI